LTSEKGAPYDEPATSLAIRRYEERLAKDPASLAFAPLADLYRKVGRISDAVAVCRQGLRRVPRYTTARLILAKTLVAAGDLESAEAELRAVVEQSPKEAAAHRALAELARQRGDVDGAIRHLEVAVEGDPADRDSRAMLRLLQATRLGPPESGLARVLRDDVFVTATFGMICLEQGLVDEAAEIFTRLLRRDPLDQRARDGLEQAFRARSGRKRG
jgi:tetratricopeptide (TPR) repeat protein